MTMSGAVWTERNRAQRALLMSQRSGGNAAKQASLMAAVQMPAPYLSRRPAAARVNEGGPKTAMSPSRNMLSSPGSPFSESSAPPGRRGGKGSSFGVAVAGRPLLLHASQRQEVLQHACTQAADKAQLCTIEIPAVRARETASADDEQPAQRVKVVKVEGSSDDNSTASIGLPALPARCIATRRLHVAPKCWPSGAPADGLAVEIWQIGRAGPAAYMPSALGVHSLLQGGNEPDRLALCPCPRPLMIITPVAGDGQDEQENGAAFAGFVRHLSESQQLGLLHLRSVDLPIQGHDSPPGEVLRKTYEERLALYPPGCSPLRRALASSPPSLQMDRGDYLVASFVDDAAF